MDAREFIANLGPASATETVLYLGYYCEVVLSRGRFTTGDIRSGFTQARVTQPANVSDLLAALKRRGLVVNVDTRSYALTHKALSAISKTLNDAGWFVSEPTESTAIVHEVSVKLHNDVLAIAHEAERAFIAEAIACMHPSVNAYRAAVIMGWAAVVHKLRDKALCRPLAEVATEIQRHYPKRKVDRPDHVHELKDSELLVVCQGLHIIDKNVRKRLESHLDLRNGCAHPTSVSPQIHTVRAFFEEIIQYVLAVK